MYITSDHARLASCLLKDQLVGNLGGHSKENSKGLVWEFRYPSACSVVELASHL